MRSASVALLLMVATAGGADAQALPQTGADDLTLPPELRGVPAAAPLAPASPIPRKRAAVHRSADAAAAPAPAKARPVAPAHPVDFGVVVRGGSATPRVYAPLGSSEAIQESGDAVGAAMRFGF